MQLSRMIALVLSVVIPVLPLFFFEAALFSIEEQNVPIPNASPLRKELETKERSYTEKESIDQVTKTASNLLVGIDFQFLGTTRE